MGKSKVWFSLVLIVILSAFAQAGQCQNRRRRFDGKRGVLTDLRHPG